MSALREANDSLISEIESLTEENERLVRREHELIERVNKLLKINADLQRENKVLGDSLKQAREALR